MADDKRSPLREQILDRAKAHMASHEVRAIEVPEWGCTIYWTPMTLIERETVRRRSQANGLADAAAHIIVMKAIDRDGHKLFDLDDKRVFLNQADSGVVQHIANAISDDRPLDEQVADAKKNSPTTDAAT
ncbi:hypothetical protein FHP25_35875 [Vineibacter terrae]|uniref:Uncharacterized protein n=1 Tax=Vineibacter terrae TaxID=2586908 RepID=A0A5C8P8N8_9HYPH|nr:hypothetical protein [Vineibacter terrae]TXL70103.1 hypothetical protein FHP25_35875 [Vineibacter terrae]